MRLEVLVENEDPVVYPLNLPKLTLGSAETCDIILKADGVSRKHLSIICEQDNFYVMDLGSTNGSFINEERLVPGRKTEFTSFFPVRIGASVLVSLLSDAQIDHALEIPLPPPTPKSSGSASESRISATDKTRTIALRDLKSKKTKELVVDRNKKRAVGKGPPPIPQRRKNNYLMPVLAGLVVAIAAYYNYRILQIQTPPKEVVKIGRVVKAKNTKPKVDPQLLIPEEELVGRSSFESAMGDLKCTSQVEVIFCDYFLGARDDGFGVVQVGLNLFVMIDGNSFIAEAKKIYPPPTEGEVSKIYDEHLMDIAIYLYLLKHSNRASLDTSKIEDFKIFLGVYDNSTQEKLLKRVVALRPRVLKEMPAFIREQNLKFIKSSTSLKALTKNYYKTF